MTKPTDLGKVWNGYTIRAPDWQSYDTHLINREREREREREDTGRLEIAAEKQIDQT